MDEELMRKFLLRVHSGLVAFEEAVQILMKQYEEQPLIISKNDDETITVEHIRNLLMEKVQNGQSEKIREIFGLFGINKLSELKSENYEEVFQMVKKI